jgi:hypothetical protein
MHIFFDTEFIEDGKTIDLISIGMVDESGRTLYAESSDCDLRRASPWVRANVIPHLTLRMSSRGDIAAAIAEFAGEKPTFWAYYGSYDWVALCQLYGTMMDLPTGWPYLVYDLRQWLDERGLAHIKQPDDAPHNALSDAHWIAATARKHGVY